MVEIYEQIFLKNLYNLIDRMGYRKIRVVVYSNPLALYCEKWPKRTGMLEGVMPLTPLKKMILMI